MPTRKRTRLEPFHWYVDLLKAVFDYPGLPYRHLGSKPGCRGSSVLYGLKSLERMGLVISQLIHSDDSMYTRRLYSVTGKGHEVLNQMLKARAIEKEKAKKNAPTSSPDRV